LFISLSSPGQSRTNPDPVQRIIKFYPNPAISFINFDFQKGYDKGFSLQIYNFLGRQVYEAKNIPARTTVNLSEYNQGIYIYQLRDIAGKVIESGKFQVSK
jgi:hypothetical protein